MVVDEDAEDGDEEAGLLGLLRREEAQQEGPPVEAAVRCGATGGWLVGSNIMSRDLREAGVGSQREKKAENSEISALPDGPPHFTSNHRIPWPLCIAVINSQ